MPELHASGVRRRLKPGLQTKAVAGLSNRWSWQAGGSTVRQSPAPRITSLLGKPGRMPVKSLRHSAIRPRRLAIRGDLATLAMVINPAGESLSNLGESSDSFWTGSR